MSEDDKKKEETAEDKIAQSTGNDTLLMSKDLEDEADELIKQAYGNKDEDDDDKSGKNDEGNKDDDNEDDDEGTDEDGDRAGEDDEIKIDPEITSLLSKLDKSEKRVKDTRADHTRGRQELKEATAKSLELEDTVFRLKTQVEALTQANTTRQEKTAEKTVEKTTGKLSDQLEAMKKIDPDLAAAMSPIVEGMFGQINDLKADLALEKQETNNRKIQADNDAHFSKLDKAHDGWEDTMQSQEFAGYLQGLSSREKRLALLDLKGGTAENIIEIFDDFQATQTDDDAGDKKKDKINAARKLSNPNNKKSKNIETGAKRKMLYTRTQIDKMTNEQYAKDEDAIDRAMANGQIENR